MALNWSEQISDRYACHLSTELADWFDSGTWQQTGRSEFRESISPEALIQRAPEAIWPGMMLSDCLPILTNTVGDWLCVRIDQDNNARQIIHWYHGGGDWIPWGKHLAEAIAFDAVADRYDSYQKRHAVAAESLRSRSPDEALTSDPYVRWAASHLPKTIVGAIEQDQSASETAETFLDQEVAEVATRCEQVVSELMNRRQDWQAAAANAQAVTRIDAQLAWAWDVVGYAAEHRDDLDSAKHAYLRSVRCSAFTDQSVRLSTHRAAGQSAKFAAARLLSLSIDLVDSDPYLRMLCREQETRRRQEITAHWLGLGSLQQQQRDHAAAYNSYVAAGWDIGMSRIESYGKLLDQISDAADGCGQRSRAKIARTHRQCLRNRYNA